MAKLFLIIICVCSACIHLAFSQMARNDLDQQYEWSKKASRQAGRDDFKSRQQGHPDPEYGRDDVLSVLDNDEFNDNEPLDRIKRHADHNHGIGQMHDDNLVEINQSSDLFIRKIFKKFSNRDTMNLVEFENMMKELRLDRFIDDSHLSQTIHSDKTNSADHGDHSNETVCIDISLNFDSALLLLAKTELNLILFSLFSFAVHIKCVFTITSGYNTKCRQ